jgi:predicted transcriptional regulator
MTVDDINRTDRTQVTLRLERDLLTAIDELATARGVDRTELARRLLSDGVARERVEDAVATYAAGRASMWSAATGAGVDLYEMIDRIADAGTPYRLDPDVLEKVGRRGNQPPPSGPGPSRPTGAAPLLPDAIGGGEAIEARRAALRPDVVRLLLVGESSPASGTHFYLANSILYRATREAVGKGLSVGRAPEGDAFLAWFQDLGGWLVDMADVPVNRLPDAERARHVAAGAPALAELLRAVEPARVVVVIGRIAASVRSAARIAGYDEGSIDVLPFPVRQWRPIYVEQLAGIVTSVLGSGGQRAGDGQRVHGEPAATATGVAETRSAYGAAAGSLQAAMAVVLRDHGNAWMRSSAIAREIADRDLWRRPSDDLHPPASQVSAHARRYLDAFQTSDLGIRLR